MSSTSSGYSDGQQDTPAQMSLGSYIPTDEERQVFIECNHESFWYRSVPFSLVSMAITQALSASGTLSVSPRFGSLPKVAFAGIFGYLAGKMSYMKTCQEKFKRLENSPLGDALRQRTGIPSQLPMGPQSELSDPDKQSFEPMFRAPDAPSEMPMRDYEYSNNSDSVMQTSSADDFSSPVQQQREEEEPRRKPILYEDLRLKNRENYEVTLTQKADTLLKPTPDKEQERPKKVKKNIYGDTWDE